MKIVIATGNPDKFKEISAILHEALGKEISAGRAELKPLSHFNLPPVIEDGKTLEANAVKKAEEICNATGLATLAEDTGIEVDYLNGAPGVYSARYAGEGKSYADNNRKLLAELKDVPAEKRTARFRTVAAIALPDGRVYTLDGKIEGKIMQEERGAGGFGYDPVFFVPEYNKTFAELTAEEKNRISHRSKAIRAAAVKILEIIGKE